MLKLVDTCGWLEYYSNGPRAEIYAGHLQDLAQVITPTIIVYELYKKIKAERGEEAALLAIAQLNKTRVIALNQEIALSAAEVSLRYKLPMADAVIYATAISEGAEVVTGDVHFRDLPGVVWVG